MVVQPAPVASPVGDAARGSGGPPGPTAGARIPVDPGGLSLVVGLAHLGWAAEGRELQADPVRHTIVARDADGTARWRYPDLVEAGINSPWEVHVHDGRVPVSDTGDQHIPVFEPDGTDAGHSGEHGTDEGHHLNGPRGRTLDAEGLLHVADRGSRRVHVCTLEGGWVRAYGADELPSPAGVAVAPDGTIFVADTHDTGLHHSAADGTHLAAVPVELDGWLASVRSCSSPAPSRPAGGAPAGGARRWARRARADRGSRPARRRSRATPRRLVCRRPPPSR